jgi:hypothetical protein
VEVAAAVKARRHGLKDPGMFSGKIAPILFRSLSHRRFPKMTPFKPCQVRSKDFRLTKEGARTEMIRRRPLARQKPLEGNGRGVLLSPGPTPREPSVLFPMKTSVIHLRLKVACGQNP